MAKVGLCEIYHGIHGKITKKCSNVHSVRYGQTFVNSHTPFRGPWSDKQLKAQDDFRKATELAAADMADPDTRAEWELIARQSKGRWKTARGAAFASHLK